MATAALMCRPHASARAQARRWKSGRRRQGCGRLANASPVGDERRANLEQRDPRSGDASMCFAYYLFLHVIDFHDELTSADEARASVLGCIFD